MDAVLGVFFWSSVIGLAAPLLLASLGETVAQRAGLFTIGIEGFMLAGAFGAVAGTILTGSATAGLCVAIVTGLGLGCLYGVFVTYSRADQVVVGIGFNLVVLGLTSMFRRIWFPGGMSSPQTGELSALPIPLLSDIPWLGGVLFDQSPAVYVAYLLVPVTAWLLWRTRAGLRIRAAGDAALAASAQGIPVLRIRLATMTANGALGALAGGVLVMVFAGGVFVDNISGGRGYLVLALTMFARWLPWRVLAGAIVFGAADALQYVGQTIVGDAVPPALFLMAPYVLALVVWLLMSGRVRGPRDLGLPLLR